MGIFDKDVHREVLTPEQFAKWDQYGAELDANKYGPMQYGGAHGAAEAAIGDAQRNMLEADYRAPIMADPSGINQARGNEMAVRAAQQRAQQYYATMAAGGGPSVAAPQYHMAANQARMQQMAQLGGASGQGAQAGGQRMAMLGAAQGAGGLAGQYGQARLGEQLQGAQGYMGGATSMNQGDLSRAGMAGQWASNQARSQLAQRGTNMQDSQYYAGLGNQIARAAQDGSIEAQLADKNEANRANAAAKLQNDLANQRGAEYFKGMVNVFSKSTGGG